MDPEKQPSIAHPSGKANKADQNRPRHPHPLPCAALTPPQVRQQPSDLPYKHLVQLIMKRSPNLSDFQMACPSLCCCLTAMQRRSPIWHAAEHQPYALSCRPPSRRPWNIGHAHPRGPQGSRGGDGLPRGGRLGPPHPPRLSWSGSSGALGANGPNAFSPHASTGLLTPLAAGPRAVFPPEVAIHVVRLACERPDPRGRSLSPWDGTGLARQLVAEGLVADLSAATVRRILAAQPLNPWRQQGWLYPKPPRAAACDATVSALMGLYTRPRRPDDLGLSADEQTSLPPRPRGPPTQPAQPHHRPNRVEQEDKRAGALTLFAACDPRSGQVSGRCEERQRQRAFIAFLETLETASDEAIRTMHLVCDHGRTHQGQDVSTGFAHHPRFVVHFTPVHCSWRHQVEPWFSMLQRKRLRIVDFDSQDHLPAKSAQFIQEWHHHAHPLNGSTKSVAKVMAADQERLLRHDLAISVVNLDACSLGHVCLLPGTRVTNTSMHAAYPCPLSSGERGHLRRVTLSRHH